MSQVATIREPAEVRTSRVRVPRVSGSTYYVSLGVKPTFFESRSGADLDFAASLWDALESAEGTSISSAEDWQLFSALRDEWKRETGILSSSSAMAMSRPYQRIIGMGDVVVPMILRELDNERDDPDHWFWALEMITGADPVPVAAYGDTVRTAEAWLDWAKWRYDW